MFGITLKTTEGTIADQLTEFVEGAWDAMDRAIEATFNEVKPELLDELDYTPPPAKRPIKWTSDKQRRWWFWHLDQIDAELGKTYERTGKLNKGWRVEWDDTTNTMKVYNIYPEAKYVTGAIAGNKGAHMQGFHQDTGWFPAYLTVDFWFAEFLEILQQRLNNELS